MEARTAVHPLADLNAYIDGALDPQSRERVDAHLGSCAICSTRVAELRATAKLIAALPALAPAPPSSAAFSAVGSPNPAARSAADTQKAVTGTAAPGEAAQQTATAG